MMKVLRGLRILVAVVVISQTTSLAYGVGFNEDFENSTIGAFPLEPWLPVATEIAGSDAAVPSTIVIDTIGPDGQPTQAAQIVDAFGEASGALFKIEPSSNVSFVTDFRIDQYGDAPGGGIVRWITVGFFETGPNPDINNNPQATIYAFAADNQFRIYFDNGGGRFGNHALGGGQITLGMWYRIEFDMNTRFGVYDVKIIEASTNMLFTEATGNAVANWDRSRANYDAVLFMKGADPEAIGTQGTMATLDNFSSDLIVPGTITDLVAEPTPEAKDRAISFIVPSEGAGQETALRVALSSLYDPGSPLPTNLPDFSSFEGEVRYVNLLLEENGDPVSSCISSPANMTFYRCATLGCEPEYRDWAEIFGGEVIHLSGSSIVPDSMYTIAQMGASCAGNEASCTLVSASLALSTARYGDADSDGLVNVTDIVSTVDVVKQTTTALLENRVYIRNSNPVPHLEATNVSDIVLHVDAVKLKSYTLNISPCP